jgi:ribonuclease T1
MSSLQLTYRLPMLAMIAMVMQIGFTVDALHAKEFPTAKTTTFATIAKTNLPKQGQETLALIRKGGPFPYTKDGTIFGNRERILPKQPRGYYKEYTVKTPGSRDRGARRIICGGEVRDTAKSECFYTEDHYASFKRITD